MDETYPDVSLPRTAWSVCLTGLMVPAALHGDIRHQFYEAIADAIGRTPNAVPPLPEIHAAKLFPGLDDDTRIAFLEKLAAIIVAFNLGIYRVGYVRTREMVAIHKNDAAILGTAFGGLLHVIASELEVTQVWPVMEMDHKPAQDQAFAGSVQFADHIASHLGPHVLSRDQRNLGEVLYSTKRSIHGALVDCAAYLLNVRTIAALDLPLSTYKRRLAKVADMLSPAIRFDEVITMKMEKPPADYVGKGPYRYMVPIVPSNDEDS